MSKLNSNKLKCFLALPLSDIKKRLRDVVLHGVEQAGFISIELDQSPIFPRSTIHEELIGVLAQSDCIIADISDQNPNIFFELGLAQAMGKGMLLISRKQAIREIPFDLQGFRVIVYDDDDRGKLSNLTGQIVDSLRAYREFPKRSYLDLLNIQPTVPFFIDWDILPERDIENLCHELLLQMGFRRLDWGKEMSDIDMIAEYPRKDPDGFEFRELWLISMGVRAPIEMFLNMAYRDPDYFIHRLFRHSERLEEFISKNVETSATLLIIHPGKGYDSERFGVFRDRFESRRNKKGPPT